VVLDPIFLGESKSYALTLIVSDAENHNFYQKIEQTLQPRKCLLVVDSATRSPLQYKTLTRGEKDPLCFEFQVDRVPGCTANIYDVLQPNLQIQTQPALSSEWTNSATIEFKDPGFKVCYSNRTELLTD